MYNVPSRTGMNMKAEAVAALCGYRHIHGIKEASGDFSQVVDILRLCGDKMAVYSGMDEVVVPMLAVGGQGVITTVGNVAPAAMHELCARYFRGDLAGAVELQFKLKPLIDALFMDVNPIPAKVALNLMGFEAGPLRLPLCEMSPANREKLKQTLSAALGRSL